MHIRTYLIHVYVCVWEKGAYDDTLKPTVRHVSTIQLLRLVPASRISSKLIGGRMLHYRVFLLCV